MSKKLRIAYLLHWNAGSEISPDMGLFKKILAQLRCWSDSGLSVAVFMISRRESMGVWRREAGDIPIFFRRYQGHLDRLKKFGELVQEIVEWNPDLVYRRQDLYYPPLERLALEVPVVIEINGDDIAECRFAPAYYYWYNRMTRGRLLSKGKGMVFVTQELALMPQFARYCKSTKVIANGIDLSQYSQLPPPSHSNPHVVFIVGDCRLPWHGVDKSLYLAHRFPDWQFDLIGIAPADLSDKLPPNVSAHGLLKRSQYEPIMAKADVALGTLALHRKDMNEACALKVREYLAYGIPTIIGYQDTDFPQPVPYLLQIPNTPTNVVDSAPAIEQFVENWRGKRVVREDVAHLDVSFKERNRISFFSKVRESV